MADLTTAQRLAAYRDELREAGFGDDEIAWCLNAAAPSLIEDVEVQADLDDQGPTIGTVEVRLDPHLNEDDLRRIVERIEDATEAAAQP